MREWFVGKFGTPRRRRSRAGHAFWRPPTLISAPTGSGKTLAAFLICIDALLRKAIDGWLACDDRGGLRFTAEGAVQ